MLDSSNVLQIFHNSFVSHSKGSSYERGLGGTIYFSKRDLMQREKSRRLKFKAFGAEPDPVGSSEKQFSSEEEDEEEESSEEEPSEEESSDEDVVMLKPIFISKKARLQHTPGKSSDVLDVKNTENNKKKRTLNAIEHGLRVENDLKKPQKVKKYGGLDDTDNLDPVAEYEEWKGRERSRLLEERKILEAEELEREEIERRREMTEEELSKEFAEKRRIEQEAREKKYDTPDMLAGQTKRYYHKGAFYQDEEILKRDYSEATEGDYRFLPMSASNNKSKGSTDSKK